MGKGYIDERMSVLTPAPSERTPSGLPHVAEVAGPPSPPTPTTLSVQALCTAEVIAQFTQRTYGPENSATKNPAAPSRERCLGPLSPHTTVLIVYHQQHGPCIGTMEFVCVLVQDCDGVPEIVTGVTV